MSATAGANKLQFALKDLRARWDALGETWRDAVRHDFEEQHIAPLETQVDTTLRAMSRLGEVLGRVRRDCS